MKTEQPTIPWDKAPKWAILAGQSSSGYWHYFPHAMKIDCNGYLAHAELRGNWANSEPVIVDGKKLQSPVLSNQNRIIKRRVSDWWTFRILRAKLPGQAQV